LEPLCLIQSRQAREIGPSGDRKATFTTETRRHGETGLARIAGIAGTGFAFPDPVKLGVLYTSEDLPKKIVNIQSSGADPSRPRSLARARSARDGGWSGTLEIDGNASDAQRKAKPLKRGVESGGRSFHHSLALAIPNGEGERSASEQRSRSLTFAPRLSQMKYPRLLRFGIASSKGNGGNSN